jgi:hypothetical protein
VHVRLAGACSGDLIDSQEISSWNGKQKNVSYDFIRRTERKIWPAGIGHEGTIAAGKLLNDPGDLAQIKRAAQGAGDKKI